MELCRPPRLLLINPEVIFRSILSERRKAILWGSSRRWVTKYQSDHRNAIDDAMGSRALPGAAYNHRRSWNCSTVMPESRINVRKVPGLRFFPP